MKWKRITGEIKHSVLVTNNLTSLDAFGRMSHVWMAEYVHAGPYVGLSGNKEDKGDFYTLDGPCFLTHYCEVPQPLTNVERKKSYIQQRRIREEQNMNMRDYPRFV